MDLNVLRQLAALDSSDALVLYSLGNKLVAEGSSSADFSEAERHLRRVLEVEPRHAAAHLALGRAQIRLGDVAGARRTLEAGLAIAKSLHHGEGGDLAPAFEELLAGLEGGEREA